MFGNSQHRQKIILVVHMSMTLPKTYRTQHVALDPPPFTIFAFCSWAIETIASDSILIVLPIVNALAASFRKTIVFSNDQSKERIRKSLIFFFFCLFVLFLVPSDVLSDARK